MGTGPPQAEEPRAKGSLRIQQLALSAGWEGKVVFKRWSWPSKATAPSSWRWRGKQRAVVWSLADRVRTGDQERGLGCSAGQAQRSHQASTARSRPGGCPVLIVEAEHL